jgi:hypothetical protein
MKIFHVPILIILSLISFPAFSVQQAFLVQNSGWMDPFYNDGNSKLKPLVMRVVEQAAKPEDKIYLAAFNENGPGNESPKIIYQGLASGLGKGALSDLGIAQKQSGAWADTDLQQAVAATVKDLFANKPGIIWVFTNNRNSPGNDPKTVERNLDFYNLLHNSPYISRTIAFPVKMQLKGKRYNTSGMMVYALAYSDEAGAYLEKIMDTGKLKVFKELPARLKPLDQDTVSIVPGEVLPSNTKTILGQDKKTLIFEFDATNKPKQIILSTRIKNLLYPYKIDSANLAYSYQDIRGQDLGIKLDKSQLTNISPGQVADVKMLIDIPLNSIPSIWSSESIAAMGDVVTVRAAIKLNLVNQQLSIDDAFNARIAQIFPNDPLSQVFKPSDRVSSSEQVIPVIFQIQYPMTPFWVLILGLLVTLGGGLYLLSAFQNPKIYRFNIDGENKTYRLKAMQVVPIKDDYDQLIGTVRKNVFGKIICTAVESHNIKFIS